jgi:hypothetical protein
MRQAAFASLHCGGGDGAARRSRPATADLPASTTLDRVDREVWGRLAAASSRGPPGPEPPRSLAIAGRTRTGLP